MTENHAVKVMINDHLKYEDKIIIKDKQTLLEVSIALDRLGLNNTLTLIDQTASDTHLLVYSIEMSI